MISALLYCIIVQDEFRNSKSDGLVPGSDFKERKKKYLSL